MKLQQPPRPGSFEFGDDALVGAPYESDVVYFDEGRNFGTISAYAYKGGLGPKEILVLA